MASPLDLGAYVAGVQGHYIDVDQVFGAQCWDQWSHYATNFLGVPSWPTYTNAGGEHPHPGWACNVYHNAARSGLTQWFEVLPSGAAAKPGDVAFWELGSAWFPLSHVATVLSVPRAGMLRCLTQNPGAVQISDLVTRGLIGYLRPKRAVQFGGVVNRTPAIPASIKKEADDMAKNSGFYYTDGKDTIKYLIVNTDSGFVSEYGGGAGNGPMAASYHNPVAAAFGTGSYAKISKGHADEIKKSCAAVRAARA